MNCSFCDRGEHEVARLVQGPGVQICNECVALCQDICQGAERDRDLKKSMEELYDPKVVKRWFPKRMERLEDEPRLEAKVAGVDERGRLVIEIYERATGKLLHTHKVRQ